MNDKTLGVVGLVIGVIAGAVAIASFLVKAPPSADEIASKLKHDKDFIGKTRGLKGDKGDTGGNGDAAVPAGTIIAFAGEVAAGQEPPGWLLCDGRTLATKSADEFARLRAALGLPQGKPIVLPDLRGQFLRGATRNRGVLSTEKDAVGPHSHPIDIPFEVGRGTDTVGYVKFEVNSRKQKRIQSLDNNGSGETRPVNIAVHWLIRY